eukprot:INCI8902.1.p1 GENE.INCI8902.1~~INCI8902.1.p1  ORF type:complete len:223 (+),score=32.47 INCI8902.1:264-932(+)
MSTGKFAKKLLSVESIKEERSEQLVRKAIVQMTAGNTAIITLIEKKWFPEVETLVQRLISLGTKETRKCTNYSKSTYSEKCSNCGRRVPAHEEEEAIFQKAVAHGNLRRKLAHAERRFGWNPLHFAVLGGAPATTVRLLVNFCPAWASEPDPLYGRYALHSAARAGPRTPWDTAVFVRDAFPDAAAIADKDGKIPSDWAVVRGGRKAGGGKEWRWKVPFFRH